MLRVHGPRPGTPRTPSGAPRGAPSPALCRSAVHAGTRRAALLSLLRQAELPVPCCAAPRHAAPCHATPCRAAPCCAVPPRRGGDVPRAGMPCDAPH
ncbi:unnamed protein product [Prorocentrum cordatum]|uniref:Uncharacterized protein n=1 Tax=Prorocentrum cordatum TaxID=2364126 RepID=A0ABN9W7T5_9DINO|nr:unnamed protein product [Polarella glacialis]